MPNEEWSDSVAAKSWKVKYYKGLGTSMPKEAKDYMYFADMDRDQILFEYSGITDDKAMMASSSVIPSNRTSHWLLVYRKR